MFLIRYCSLRQSIWVPVKLLYAKHPGYVILFMCISLLIVRKRLNDQNQLLNKRQNPLNCFPISRETRICICLKPSDLKVPRNSGQEGELYAFSRLLNNQNNNDIVRIISTSPNVTEINFICNDMENNSEPGYPGNGIFRRFSNVGNQPLRWVRVPNFKIYGTPEGHGELYMFSAYLDKDEENMDSSIARIIAIVPNVSDMSVTCLFFGEMGNLIAREEGTIRRISNFVAAPYTGGFIICPLNTLESQVVSVSVSNGTRDETITSIPLTISKIPTNSKPKHEFAMCIQPVFNYDEVFDFIQWVEFHKMMGVTHFTFYNLTMGPRVSCALHALLDTDSLTLINGWGSIPLIHDLLLIFNYAQYTQMAECNLRYRGRAEHYVNVDFDEYIVPNFTLAKNYKELIEILADKMRTNETLPVSQYIFRNAFFTQTKNDGDMIYNLKDISSLKVEDLILHSRVKTKVNMEGYYDRSKCITKPSAAVEPGVHREEKRLRGYSSYNVSENLAYVHHYRDDLPNHLFSPNATLVEDTNPRSFTDELLRRVKKSVAAVYSMCV